MPKGRYVNKMKLSNGMEFPVPYGAIEFSGPAPDKLDEILDEGAMVMAVNGSATRAAVFAQRAGAAYRKAGQPGIRPHCTHENTKRGPTAAPVVSHHIRILIVELSGAVRVMENTLAIADPSRDGDEERTDIDQTATNCAAMIELMLGSSFDSDTPINVSGSVQNVTGA